MITVLFGVLWYFQGRYWYYMVFSDFSIGTVWYFVVLSDFGIGTIWYFMVLSDFCIGTIWYFLVLSDFGQRAAVCFYLSHGLVQGL